MDQPNPEVDTAIGIRSDDLGLDDGQEHKKSRKLNSVVRRQLQSLPIFTPIDIERAMRDDKLTTVADFIQANVEALRSAAAVAQQQAETMFEFLHHDFRLSTST